MVVVLLKIARFSAKERLEALSGLCSPSRRWTPGRDLGKKDRCGRRGRKGGIVRGEGREGGIGRGIVLVL